MFNPEIAVTIPLATFELTIADPAKIQPFCPAPTTPPPQGAAKSIMGLVL